MKGVGVYLRGEHQRADDGQGSIVSSRGRVNAGLARARASGVRLDDRFHETCVVEQMIG